MTNNGLCGTGDGGLQAERTALAWTRMSLAVFANGALLIVRDLPNCNSVVRLGTAGPALGCAFVVYLVGTRRKRTLSLRPRPHKITPHNQVRVTGISVLALILLTALSPLLRP